MARGAARNSKGDGPKKKKKKKRNQAATHTKDGRKLSKAERAGIVKRKRTIKRRKQAVKIEKDLQRARPEQVPVVTEGTGKAVDVVVEQAGPSAQELKAAIASIPEEPLVRSVDEEGKVTWTPKPGLEGNEGLEFAAYAFAWAENFVEIRTKEGKILQFRMNAAQLIMAQFVALMWGLGLPVRLMLPKSRQQGSSTFWQVLFFALCELKGGYRVMVVAHDEAGANQVFSRAFTALRRIRTRDDWDDPKLITEQASWLVWETESSMQSGTIKTGDAIGRGGTLNAIHFSETANFSDRGINAKGACAAVMNSMAEDRWTIVVHESTAKGKDAFFWPKCEDARDPTSGSTFRLIFLPWFLTPEYSMSWESYRAQLVAAGKPDPGKAFRPTLEEGKLRTFLSRVRVGKGQRSWRYRTELTDEQLVWRRWAITNKCENDVDQFKREYPSTYEEAFSASATCFFKPHVVDWYRVHQRDYKHRGYLHSGYGDSAFQATKDGATFIWKLPKPSSEYVIGADTGGDAEPADPYCAYVLDKEDLEVVAMIHGWFEWDAFTDQLYLLGKLYNTAEIVVENNHRPAVAKRLHRKAYPNLFYYHEQDQRKTKIGRIPGYNMNVKTRKDVLAVIKRAHRTCLVDNPDADYFKEMETFVWVPKTNAQNPAPGFDGTYKAPQGQNDDRIISFGLALVRCDLPDIDERKPEDEPERQSHALKWFLEMQERDAGLHEDRPLKLGVRPVI